MVNGFAGVNLDTALETTQGAEAPEIDTQISDPKGEEKEANSPTAQEIVELEKLERFRFDGRELTPKELKDSFMMRSDYTKKTQELSEARKYADNFETDLASVMKNPQLLAEMKKIYPAAYVQMAEKYLTSQQSNAETKTESSNQNLPPQLQSALEKIERYERQMADQTTQATLETLNSHHERLATKFPYADPDVVDTRLQVLIEKGADINRENIGRVIENAYKQHHEAVESRLNAQKKQKVEEQVAAGKKARDIGHNGGTPAQAPQKWKSIHEGMKHFDS